MGLEANCKCRQRGSFRGLYNGAQVNFCRALISWGIVNAVYEQLNVIFKECTVCSQIRLMEDKDFRNDQDQLVMLVNETKYYEKARKVSFVEG